MRVKFKPKRLSVGGAYTSFPEVHGVVVRVGARTSPPLRLIVDTGSSATLLPWWVATTLGIHATLPTAPAASFVFGSGGVSARQAVVDIDVASHVLSAVPVFFVPDVPSIAGRDGLLGQHGFFDRVKLVQLHDRVPPYFYLDL